MLKATLLMSLHYTHNTLRLPQVTQTLQTGDTPTRHCFVFAEVRSKICRVTFFCHVILQLSTQCGCRLTCKESAPFFLTSKAAVPTLEPKALCGAFSTIPTLLQILPISFVLMSVLLVRSQLFLNARFCTCCHLASADGWI